MTASGDLNVDSLSPGVHTISVETSDAVGNIGGGDIAIYVGPAQPWAGSTDSTDPSYGVNPADEINGFPVRRQHPVPPLIPGQTQTRPLPPPRVLPPFSRRPSSTMWETRRRTHRARPMPQRTWRRRQVATPR